MYSTICSWTYTYTDTYTRMIAAKLGDNSEMPLKFMAIIKANFPING